MYTCVVWMGEEDVKVENCVSLEYKTEIRSECSGQSRKKMEMAEGTGFFNYLGRLRTRLVTNRL